LSGSAIVDRVAALPTMAAVPRGQLEWLVAHGEIRFDPFFTTKPVGEGMGLGLDIVRTIVRNHRGTVEVDSRPGRTEFRVRLPLA
jgi:hypothetical protein